MEANQSTTGLLLPTTSAITLNSSEPQHLLAVTSSNASAFDSLRQTVVVTYLFTFVLGVAGNGLVIYIVGYYNEVRRKSVANYYIWNLSFADFFYVLTLPLFCFATLTGDWPFGEFMCKAAYAIRETNKFSSVFTLVALSMDRYLASFYHLGHLRTVKVGVGVCVGVWVLCVFLSLPYWMYSVVKPTSQLAHSCRFVYSQQQFWTYFQLVVGLVVPFAIITGCYCGLVARLRHILKSGPAARRRKVQKPSRRMTRTVLVVVLIFLFCQTPYYIMQILNLRQSERIHSARQQSALYRAVTADPDVTDASVAPLPQHYMPSKSEIQMYLILQAVAQILVFVSSCCNPIVYGLLNENYRQLYTAVCCRGPCHVTRHTTSEETTDSTPRLQQVTYRFHFTLRGSGSNGLCGANGSMASCKAISTATTTCHLPPPITEEVELE